MICEARGGFPKDELAEKLAPIAKRLGLRGGARLALDEAVYLPVDGVASLILERDDTRFQVGFATRGDVIGLQRLFTASFPPIRAEVFKAGEFICVDAKALCRIIAADSRLKERLAVYALKATAHFLEEAAETVALTLERRVASWIARCRTILGSDIITVTHQDLAHALGVRRSGVTVALHVLEGDHLIRSKRGRIEVLDHASLTDFARTGAVAGQRHAGPATMRANDAAPISLEGVHHL